MMEIEYTLAENDMFALAKCRLIYMPGLRQRQVRQRVGVTLFISAIALVAWFFFVQTTVAFILAALALLIYSLYPTYQEIRLKQLVSATYRNEKSKKHLSKHVLSAAPDGLTEKSEAREISTSWERLDKVIVTPTHCFISADRSFSIVIPKEHLSLGNYDEFIQALNSFMSAHKPEKAN
jgi:hypothetical protein